MVTDSPLMKPWTVTRLTSQYVMLHMGKGRRPQATVQGHERTFRSRALRTGLPLTAEDERRGGGTPGGRDSV